MRTLLIAVVAVVFPAAAQTPATLLSGDPVTCWTMSGGANSIPAAVSQVVDVTGMEFTRAIRVRTGEIRSGVNSWDIRPRCFMTLPARRDDTVVVRFWMRTLSSPEQGTGFATFVIEKGADPWTKSIQYTAAAGPQWKLFEVPFRIVEDYTTSSGPGSYNLSFWVVFPNQEIEIGGFSLLDYGTNYPFSNLSLTGWPYDGHAADAPWRTAAAARIEKYRKTDIVVVARDNAGNPIPNAQVRLRQKQHAFGFGSAIAHTPVAGADANARKYRELVPQLFSRVVTENVLKWPFYEAGWGRDGARAIFDWLPTTGIREARGHVLVWPGKSNLPADVVSILNAPAIDKEALRRRIDDHIRQMMVYTHGKVTEWDVLNEPYTNNDIQKAMGDEEIVRWFQIAREADPAVKLYINDYDITEGGGYNLQHIRYYDNLIRFLLDRGAPIDGIGLQSHFSVGLTPPDRVYEILDQFARFGKELQVTEFDVNIKDEQLQAEYMRDYLTLCFSHPAMKGFMLWGFWAGAHWLPDGAMYRSDWSARPMADVWNDLVFKQWWTTEQGITGPDGTFRTRGFLGDYDIEITSPSGTTTLPLSAGFHNVSSYLVTGPALAPLFTEAGVAHAATFQAGPVAPGEVITIFGTGFGPVALQQASYNDSGQLPSTVGDTRVLFDGVPAPMIYSSANQVSAIVPYSVRDATRIEIEYLGIRTPSITVPVTAASPGIYTWSGDPRRAVVVNNEAGATSLNSTSNPAARGSYVTFFATGEGALTPSWTDGRLPAWPDNPRPSQDVRITIGGIESNCPGNWTGLIYAGVLQVNARVPENASIGPEIPVQISVGSGVSRTNVGLSVR